MSSVWPRVSSALTLLFWLLIVKVVVGVLFVGYVAAALGSIDSLDALAASLTVMSFVLVFIFAVDLAIVVALSRYAAVPEVTGARGRAIAAAVIGALVLGADIIAALPIFGHDFEAIEKASAWDTVSSIGTVIQFFNILASLRALADHFGLPEVSKKASLSMTLVGILIVVVIFAGLVAGAARSELGIVIVGLAAAVIGIWALVLQLIVTHRLAQASRDQDNLAAAFA